MAAAISFSLAQLFEFAYSPKKILLIFEGILDII